MSNLVALGQTVWTSSLGSIAWTGALLPTYPLRGPDCIWSNGMSIIYSQTTCKTSVVEFRLTFHKSSVMSNSASLTSVHGALLSACSSTPQRWRFCGLVLWKISPGSKVISVGQNVIEPVTVLSDLGVLMDEELSMRQHVAQLSRTCFFHLRRLRPLRRQLGRDVTATLVCVLVLL